MSLFLRKLFVSLALVASFVAVLGGVTPVHADISLPKSETLCNGTCSVDVKNGNKESIVSVIISIAQYATYVIVAVSVLFLVYGGFLYVTDNGSGDSAKKGQKVLVNAIIGLVIAILAYTVVSVIGNIVAGTKLEVK
jgi:hypothetical protein